MVLKQKIQELKDIKIQKEKKDLENHNTKLKIREQVITAICKELDDANIEIYNIEYDKNLHQAKILLSNINFYLVFDLENVWIASSYNNNNNTNQYKYEYEGNVWKPSPKYHKFLNDIAEQIVN